MEKRGYKYIPPQDRDKATLDMQVALPYFPSHGPARITNGSSVENSGYCMVLDHEKNGPPIVGKCFGAGTPVLTPDGIRNIESLRPGDRVLTDLATDGSRHAAPILSVHQSTACRALRLSIGGESIVTTEGHPFAQLGIGWTRAGDLKPGDQILATNGPARVEGVSVEAAQTVWNLKLADSHSYLVGRAGMVVHDISPVVDFDRFRGTLPALLRDGTIALH
jgi:Pretoxin HINT domain